MTSPKTYTNDIKVEVQVPTTGLQNLIKNPDGELGAWAWETPTNGGIVNAGGLSYDGKHFLSFMNLNTAAAHFLSEFMPVMPNQSYAARFTVAYMHPGHNFKARFEWYNSSKVYLSSSTQTAALSSYATHYVPAVVAPANTFYVKVRFDFYYQSTTAPLANSNFGLRDIMFTQTATSNFAYSPPHDWLAITGSVTSLNIEREAMNLGTMSVVIKDETLDPTLLKEDDANVVLTPGKLVRVRAREGTTFKNLFSGKISNARVDYDKEKVVNSVVEGTISITAADALGDLVNQGESRSVASISDLPYLLEGKGVPWNCNNKTGHLATVPTIPVTNENTSMADQIVLTRDTVRGYAWIDKDGVLQAQNYTTVTAKAVAHRFADYTAAAGQAIPNPSFTSTGVGPWGPYEGVNATLTRDTTVFRTSTASLKVTGNAAGSVDFDNAPFTGAITAANVSQLGIPVTGGRQYTFSFYTRAATTARSVEAFLEFFTADAIYTGEASMSGVTNSTSSWGSVRTITFRVPPQSAYAYINVYAVGAASGEAHYFDDFSLTDTAPTAGYSEIDVDWNTEDVMNQIELKHLRFGPDAQPEEVVVGTYENADSVDRYGPRKSTFTIVGTQDHQTFANNILNVNAYPQKKANSLRMPIKDDASRTTAINTDLCQNVWVSFGQKVGGTFRIQTVSHTIDASGWYMDLTFASEQSNAAPQMTPAPSHAASYVADTGWVDPALQNAWVNYGDVWETCQYRRKDGIVYLKGLIRSGNTTDGANIFLLPVGCRPSSNKHIATASANQLGIVKVMNSGWVACGTPVNAAWLSLANISFPADG